MSDETVNKMHAISSGPESDSHGRALVELGKRPNGFGVLLLGALAAAIGMELIHNRFGLATILLGIMVLMAFLAKLSLYMRRPLLRICDGQFEIRLPALTLVTPAANIRDIRQIGGLTCITFANLEIVEPKRSHSELSKVFGKKGYHWAIDGRVFVADQVDRLRLVLRLPLPNVDVSTTAENGFNQRLNTLTPHVWVMPTIVVLNVVIFAAMVLRGADLMQPQPSMVVNWGANGPETFGQWWRLLTNTFLHFGLLHLGLNMWVLWDVGRLLERLLGNVDFGILYIVSGLFASLASLAWHPNTISAGASGAVFGVVGALLAIMAICRASVPPTILRPLRGSLFSFLGYNLIIGAMSTQIDMAAHMGGLIAGFVFGLLLRPPLVVQPAARRMWRNLAAAIGAGIALPVAIALLPPAPRNIRRELEQIGQLELCIIEKYNVVVTQAQRGEISDNGLARIIEHDILPPWREDATRLSSLLKSADVDKAKLAKIHEYMLLRQQSWELLLDALRTEDQHKMSKFNELCKAVDRRAKALTSPSTTAAH